MKNISISILIEQKINKKGFMIYLKIKICYKNNLYKLNLAIYIS